MLASLKSNSKTTKPFYIIHTGDAAAFVNGMLSKSNTFQVRYNARGYLQTRRRRET